MAARTSSPLADGYRGSTKSWADMPRDCARRGMRALVLAVGDGALGFSNALREVSRQGGPLMVPQDRQRAGCAAAVRVPGREEGPRRDLGTEGKDHALRRRKSSPLPTAPSSQGSCEDH